MSKQTVFSKRLKQARKSMNINQKDLAISVGHISESAISNYEQARAEPDTSTLKIIANILNVSVDWLIGNDLPDKSIIDLCHPKKEQIPLFEEPYIIAGQARGSFIYYIDNINLKLKADFAIIIKEDALAPYYDSGDTVFITITKPKNNDLVCFSYKQKIFFGKCLLNKDKTLSFESVSNKEETTDIDDSYVILGVVCSVLKNNVLS